MIAAFLYLMGSLTGLAACRVAMRRGIIVGVIFWVVMVILPVCLVETLK